MPIPVIRNAEEWEAYKSRAAGELTGGQGIPVAWGPGPLTYPALVASMPLPNSMPPKIASCYVYAHEAAALLKAAGYRLAAPDGAEATKDGAVAPPNQAQFNRWMTAMMYTLTYYAVETGLAKPDQFEEKLLEFLEMTDRQTEDQRGETLKLMLQTMKKS
jgi:hypothetical protein